MHFTKYFTVAAIVTTGVLAAPREAPAKPTKPASPPANSQSNVCGNGAAPYCCNTDNLGKYTVCALLGANAACSSSSTTVCCNLNSNGGVNVQLCLNNAVVVPVLP